MNEIQKRIIKLTLYVFFLYVFFLKGIEQFYFLNEGLFRAFLALFGLLLTWKAPIKYSLFYRLLVFPMIGATIFEQFVKPHWGHVQHVQDLFWLLYMLLIILVTHQAKVWILFVISIWGFFVTFVDLPAKLYASLTYWNSFSERKERSPVVDLLQHPFKGQKTYVICLDGYPDFTNEPTTYGSTLSSYLVKNGFKKGNAISIGDTPQSVPFLLSNKSSEKLFFAIPFFNYNRHIVQLMKQSLQEESIQVHAVFNDYWIATYYFQLFSNPPVNYYVQKIFQKFFSEAEKPVQTEYMNAYHWNLLRQMSTKANIQVFHFLTFHGWGYAQQRNLSSEVAYADFWLKKSIERINQINPNAHVIVFSDHGERFTKGFDRKKALLYYK